MYIMASYSLQILQTIEGAPGEVITFRISAVDESDNWQSAIWNINEDNQVSHSKTDSSWNQDVGWGWGMIGDS